MRLRDAVHTHHRQASAQNRLPGRRRTLAKTVAALGFTWNDVERAGYDAQGRLIWAEDTVRSVERLTGCRRDPVTGRWTDPDGDVLDTALADTTPMDLALAGLYQGGCDHLRLAIRDRFDVDIAEPSWRHWNSGVFVFDEGDGELLDLWHHWSMEIVRAPEWEARDQGTLAAAVWKLHLERHPCLPIEFNFLADFNRSDFRFDASRGFTMNGLSTYVQPCFVHVYHHFGDASWPVWQWIESIGRSRTTASPPAAPRAGRAPM